MQVTMTDKTHQSADLHLNKVKQATKNGAPEPVVSMTRELGLEVCPISERIIKETSVEWKKAMEMLADL